MSGIDYQKALITQRNNYVKNVRDQKRSHDERVNQLNKQHNHVVESQRNAYLNDKKTMETTFGDRYDKMQSNMQESLSEKSKKYNEETLRQKEDFQKASQDNVKKFNQRYSALEREFKKNIEETNQTNSNIQGQLRDSYDERVDSIRKKAQLDLKEYQRNVLGRGEDIKDTFSGEKQELISAHQDETRKLMKSELQKRNLLKDNIVKDMRLMKKHLEDERIRNRDIQRDNFERVITDSNDKVKHIQEKSKAEIKRMSESQVDEVRRQNKAFTKRFSDQERRYNKNLRDQEISARRNSTSKGSVQYEINKERRKVEEQQLANQKKILIDERNKVIVEASEKIDKAQGKFIDELKENKLEYAEALERQKWLMNNDFTKELVKDRLKQEELIQSFENKIAHEKEVAYQQFVSEREQSKEKVDHLKTDFHKSLVDARVKSEKNYTDLKFKNVQEKKQIAKVLNEQNSQQKAFMRKVFTDRMDNLARSYENRIDYLEAQNKVLRQNMEDTIGSLVRDTQEEIQRQQEEYAKVAKAEVKAQQEISQQKVKKLRDNISRVHTNYNAKINEVKLASDRNMKKMSYKYDEILKNERKKYQKIIDQNNRFFEREMTRLKTANESEKTRLISQYEYQIQKMRDAFQRKQNEIEHFSQIDRA